MLSPDAVLVGYMRDMNAWEKRCAKRMEECIAGDMDFDQAREIGTGEYMDIFRRYCSQSKASPRDFYYTEPPDYNAEGEMILGVNEKSFDAVEIYTQQNYSHRKRHIFILAWENEEWRLVERKVLLDGNEFLETTL